MYDYKLIEAYAAVIQEGGFEKAASRLFITQSAVSQRIKQLEEQFGQIILLRSSPPQPTDFGRKILGLYNQVCRLENDLRTTYRAPEDSAFTALPIGINADTLATWFFPAIQVFLGGRGVVLDLLVDDQEETHQFLKDGKVLGCITTRSKPLQGCSSHYLGDVEYGLFCSENFRRKWFAEGFDSQSAVHAPMITFNRKDQLNRKILQRLFGELPDKYTTHYIPSAELFMDFIQNDLAYGAIPDQQSSGPLKRGEIHDLAPEYREKVSLFWQCWNLDSTLLHDFTDALLKGFKKVKG